MAEILRYDGFTLIDACADENFYLVKILIERGANIEAKDDYGNTPLIMASIVDWVGGVKFLIGIGADIEAKDNDGRTPLIKATVYACVEVVKLLIESGADLEAKNNFGNDFTRYLSQMRSDEINKFMEGFNFSVKPAKRR